MLEGVGRFAPERSLEDILSGRIRLVLGGQTYVVPVLSIRANREWTEGLEGELAALLDHLTKAGNDSQVIIKHLLTADNRLFDLLVSYDKTGVLPPREELEDLVRPHELLIAVMGIWRAASPLADMGLGVMYPSPVLSSQPEPEPTSSSPKPTAGRSTRSRRKSRTSSSSSTSTQPKND